MLNLLFCDYECEFSLKLSISLFFLSIFLGVTGGVVVAQVASLQELLGTDELWHYALSAYLLLVVVCFIPFAWYPESPKYLYIVADKRDLARKGN